MLKRSPGSDGARVVGAKKVARVKWRDWPCVPGPQRHGRALLDLSRAGDERLSRAAEQRARAERGADGGGHVLHRPCMSSSDEEESEVGRPGLGTESVEHLADRLAGGLRRQRMLRQPCCEGH